ncbi:MAG TPA: serine/threonine-protein kinase [Kofleriaceae bacterium]|nr:serine/threonine-protein kinase [Kofleriaceae bacterium]
MRLCPICGEVYPETARRCRAHDEPLLAWREVEETPTGEHASGVVAGEIGDLTDPEVPAYAALTPPMDVVIVDPSLMERSAPRLRRVLGGRYRLGERIGIGGYGVVFDAFDERLAKRVAIKVLSPSVAQDPEVVRRFEREALAASRVRHEGIVDITDYAVEPAGTSYIVMEYLDGADLCEALATAGALAPARALAIAVQCASALTAAHAARILHRDLKPANIFLVRSASRPDLVKIIDFGIAKIIGGDGRYTSVTSASKVIGTPFYMAPEQGQGLEIDGRADVYALGVILFEMLTGERPFVGSSSIEILTNAATQPRIPPSRRRAELAAWRGIDELVLRAIARDRGARFASMRAFGDAIVACLAATDPARLPGLPAIDRELDGVRDDREAALASTGPSTIETSSGELTGARSFRTRSLPLALVATLAAAIAVLAILRADRAEDGIVPAAPRAIAPVRTLVPAPAPTPAITPPAPPPAVAPPSIVAPTPPASTVRMSSTPSGAAVISRRRGRQGTTPLDAVPARHPRASTPPPAARVETPAQPGLGIKDW